MITFGCVWIEKVVQPAFLNTVLHKLGSTCLSDTVQIILAVCWMRNVAPNCIWVASGYTFSSKLWCSWYYKESNHSHLFSLSNHLIAITNIKCSIRYVIMVILFQYQIISQLTYRKHGITHVFISITHVFMVIYFQYQIISKLTNLKRSIRYVIMVIYFHIQIISQLTNLKRLFKFKWNLIFAIIQY